MNRNHNALMLRDTIQKFIIKKIINRQNKVNKGIMIII